MTWSVLVTHPIPTAGIERLKNRGLNVKILTEEKVLSEKSLIDSLQNCEALLPLLTDNISASVIASAPKLRIIANHAVGYNNIDVQAATKRNIAVTNTPGVLTETTADLTWALIMACARRIVEGDKFIRDGQFTGWEVMLLLGVDVFGKTLGIIGAGRIGSAVARRARGFNMRILYADSKPNTVLEKETGAEYADLKTLLRRSDFVTLHVPLTEKTKHFIGSPELQAMKKSAYLINTSRGPVIDEIALVRALQNRQIAGAGLDVYENEPALTPGLSALPNVVLLPHIGSATDETRGKMALMAANNIVDMYEGGVPKNLVNQIKLV